MPVARSPRPKKITKATLKAKARTDRRKGLAAWSKMVRAGGACEVCGRTEYIDAHHVLGKEHFPRLQFEPLNGVALCKSHHKFGAYSAHRNPIWFAEWLRENRPEKFEWAKKHLGE